MKLRDKLIEIIRENTNLSIRNRIKFCDELEALFQSEIKRVIEKDERPLISNDYPESGKLKIDTTKFNEAIIRNKLRAEQRKKAKIYD